MTKIVVARLTFTQMVGKLLDFAWKSGIPVIVDWVKRDLEVQQKLFESGKSTTLNSKHLRGLAMDLYVINVGDHAIVKDGTDERYKILGEFWEDLGGIWGGRWHSLKDSGHFEFDPYDGE